MNKILVNHQSRKEIFVSDDIFLILDVKSAIYMYPLLNICRQKLTQ